MIRDIVPGWQLLWFVALRRLTPVGMVLLTTGLLASLVLPFHLAPARFFTMTVTVLGYEVTYLPPIAAIEVLAGNCLRAATTPSPAGGATFVLPAGNYTVTARTNADGRAVGWAMAVVAVHLDRHLAVAIDHEIHESDLDSRRGAPPAPCPGR